MNQNVQVRPLQSAKLNGPILERTTFRTSRLLDFCSRKELIAQTGHQPEEWPLVLLKELVDNALDACEEAEVAPEITITVDDRGVTVADNGPGIPESTVAGVLDFNSRASSREAYVAPDRGAQGNALMTLVAMPFVLDGKRGDIEIVAQGVRHRIVFTVDAIRQKPLITHEPVEVEEKNGTKITVFWPDSASSILDDACDRFLQIADDFTWINPHLRLTIDWSRGTRVERVIEPTAPGWEKWKPSYPTCPHWYEPEHLQRLIAAYIAHDADNGDARTVREFIAEFRGLSGSQKQKIVLETTGLHRAPLSALAPDNEMDAVKIVDLLAAMKANTRLVKPKALGVIGKEHFEKRFKATGCEMESFQYRKVMGVQDGAPCVIETAFGWCPDLGERRLVTGVNWSPGIINPFRHLRYGASLDTILSQQRMDGDEPVILVLHAAEPRVEYQDRGKSSVVIEAMKSNDIISAVTGVTKKWAKQRKAEERHAHAEANRRFAMTRSRYTVRDAAWDVMEEAYLKASGGGRLPAHARQVMYAARPAIQERTGQTLSDQYFTQTLLPDYIEETGVDWNVVYDARGHFTEPHTDLTIGLGTIGVRNYLHDECEPHLEPTDIANPKVETHGPGGRFGAILFIEKEGFMPLFKETKLAERYDIAIMSTKGMSNTASRELIDRLCSDIPLFVLHDFDKAGFSILGTLRRDTRRYTFVSAPEVIDLGLRLGDIEGLEVESAYDRASEWSIRHNLELNGATDQEIDFLLNQRVELNAFTSDALMAWIEAKLDEHGVKKIIPDDDLLEDAWRTGFEHAALESRIDDLMREAEDEASEANLPSSLREVITERLKKSPQSSWDEIVFDLAKSAHEKAGT